MGFCIERLYPETIGEERLVDLGLASPNLEAEASDELETRRIFAAELDQSVRQALEP